MDHGSARGLELEWSSVLERGLGKNVQDLRGGVDTMVPGNAFNTRAVTSSGTSGSLVGKKVQQMPGVIGWAALVNSGCTIATSTPAVVEAEQDLILAGGPPAAPSAEHATTPTPPLPRLTRADTQPGTRESSRSTTRPAHNSHR